ncbi:beta-lactamase/transpeptidase-like protein [Powellomyces hirtus]|nr:beta-lactamase/transpeptidase-like protein [Powellomyces hirtus]
MLCYVVLALLPIFFLTSAAPLAAHDAPGLFPATLPADYCRPPLPPLLTKLTWTHDMKERLFLLNERFGSLLKDLYQKTHPNSSQQVVVSVVLGNRTISSHGIGHLISNDSTTPVVDANSIFRIASISKVFTALHLLLAQEDGLVKEDDKLTAYLKDFTMIDPSGKDSVNDINLAMLASHDSGIPPNACPVVRSLEDTYNCPNTDKELFPLLARRSLVFQPNGRFPLYSNLAFGLLSRAIETAAQEDQISYLRRKVFDKLGMDSTAYEAVSPDRMARTPATNLLDFGYMNPGAGFYSTANDLSNFLSGFLLRENSGVLRDVTIRHWLKPTSFFPDAGRVFYGMPWEIIRTSSMNLFTKAGTAPPYNSQIGFLPDLGLGHVLLHTGDQVGYGLLSTSIHQFWRDELVDLQSELAKERYAGIYRSNNGYCYNVDVVNATLVLRELVTPQNDTAVFSFYLASFLTKDTPAVLVNSFDIDEFRIGLTFEGLVPGCYITSATLDPLADEFGNSGDLIRFVNAGSDDRILVHNYFKAEGGLDKQSKTCAM